MKVTEEKVRELANRSIEFILFLQQKEKRLKKISLKVLWDNIKKI